MTEYDLRTRRALRQVTLLEFGFGPETMQRCKLCPECGSPFLQLLEGKELQISSIEVDLPDEEDDTTKPAQENESSEADQMVDSEHEKE